MDAFAHGLLIAQRISDDKALSSFVEERYGSFRTGIGTEMMSGHVGLADVEQWVLSHPHPALLSGRQEMLENIFNFYIQ
jgi:xylose isomerase